MKNSFSVGAKLLTTFLFLFLLQTTNAQTPTPTPPDTGEDTGEILKVDSRLVIVPVSAIDANGAPVMNLTKTDFRLAEEGKTQEIAEISSAEDVPLEIALLIDVSSSVNSLFEYEKDAAARFLQGVMKPQDRAAVFLVGDQPKMIQPRDTAEKTAATIRAIVPDKKFTAFYDTVFAALDYLKKNAPERSRRVILTLTDGEDTYSRNTLKVYQRADREIGAKINSLTTKQLAEIRNRYRIEAQEKNYGEILRGLQNADTVFYSINPSGTSIRFNRITSRGQAGLDKFANETGGTAFLPEILPQNLKNEPLKNGENERKNKESLDRIFRQIAAELRAQYLLQYYSQAEFAPGKYVGLRVDSPTKTNIRIKSRQGYFSK